MRILSGKGGVLRAVLRVVCASLVLCPALAWAQPSVLRVCHESADVHPWSTKAGTGLNYELLNLAANAAGVRLEFDIVPWKRCLLLLKNNEVDGAFAASFKLDRLESGVYPMAGGKLDLGKRLHIDRYVLVRRKGSRIDWDGSQFSQVAGPIGAQLGYSVVDQLKALKVEVDEGSQSAQDVLRKLQLGRIDAAALLVGEAQAVLARDAAQAQALEILPLPLVEKPYFLMLSHGLMARDEKLVRKLWASIERVRESAAYQARERAVFTEGRK